MRCIALEGLPGGGKTTLLERLRATTANTHVLAEHILSEIDLVTYSADNPEREDAYRLNWLVKDQVTQLYSYKDLVILDRCFISTLAYNYARSMTESNAKYYEETLAWINDSLAAGLLHPPDVCIVLRVDPEQSNIRKNREEQADMLWSNQTALQYTNDFYENTLPTLSQLYKQLVFIDTSKHPEQVAIEVMHVVF